jgi:hypothetical protein
MQAKPDPNLNAKRTGYPPTNGDVIGGPLPDKISDRLPYCRLIVDNFTFAAVLLRLTRYQLKSYK